MKVMFVLFARWKGAKCTIEHPTHILHAYHMSLASLQPNQVSCLCWGALWHVVVLLTNHFGMNKHFFISKLYVLFTFVTHFFLIILLIWLFAFIGSLQIVWEPYKSMLGSLLTYCMASQHIWRSIVPLILF